MKRLYKCEFCDFIGSKDDVLKHENICTYKIRSCDKCSNAMIAYDIKTDNAYFFCNKGKYVKKEDGFNIYCDMFAKRKTPMCTQYMEQINSNQYIKNKRRN